MIRRLVLLAAPLLALLAGAATPAQPAARAADRVVLKSGRELFGKFGSERAHKVYFVDDEIGALVVPRMNVRTIVRGDADPGLFAPIVLESAEPARPKSYVRLEAAQGDAPAALSTGVVRLFDEKTRSTVFLVGAVHVADAAYYERLQDILDGCDVVLYEGVGHAKDGAAPDDREMERYDALFKLQLKVKDLLGLTFQRDGLDYTRPFWKNADVDMESLSEQMQRENVALPTDPPLVRGLLKLVVGMLDATQIGENPEFRRQLKSQVAAALTTADALFGGSMRDLGRVLIEWRNDAALQHLDEEIAGGAPGRWIAVFYGAGHLPDMAAKLTQRGFEFQGVGWVRAWELR